MIYRIIASILLIIVLGFLYAAFSGDEPAKSGSTQRQSTTQEAPPSYSGFGK